MNMEVPNSNEMCREELKFALEHKTAEYQALALEFEQFSHAVSHDLRAPLRTLEGFATILLEDCGGQFDPQVKRSLEIILNNSRKVSMFIEDLLVFSHLNQQKFSPEVVDMDGIVKEVIETFRFKAPKTKFKITSLPKASADRQLISQVWHHLLSNAVKFTRKQNDAKIEIGFHSQPNQNVYFVRDNGVGFDMKYADRLFRFFQRLHSEDEYEGHGVGLAMVRRIIFRHGGKTWAEGDLNLGACFFFSLPNSAKNADKLPLEKSPAIQGKSGRL